MVKDDLTTKRLYRSRQERMIAGVAGGLGQYFNVDPVVLRVALVALLFVPGVGGVVVLSYIALAIIVPKRPLDESEPVVTGSSLKVERTAQVLAYVLVAAGLLILAGNLGWYAFVPWHVFWPLALVAVGVLLLLRRQD